MKWLHTLINDVKQGQNIDVYLTIGVCLVVLLLDLFNVIDLELVLSAVLLTLGILAYSTLATRKTLENLRSNQQVGKAIIRPIDAKHEFMFERAKRANAARRFIHDASLNHMRPRNMSLSGDDSYRQVRDRRVLNREITFRRVEVIFTTQHVESVVLRLLRFEGAEFYLRHYECPPQPIPSLHILSFDDEHIYMGGFYPSEPSSEENILYLNSDAMSAFARDYWQHLWLNATPLNESGITNWQEVRRVAKKVGLSDAEFDSMVENVRVQLGRSQG